MSQQKYSFTNPESVISSNEDRPRIETSDEKYRKRLEQTGKQQLTRTNWYLSKAPQVLKTERI